LKEKNHYKILSSTTMDSGFMEMPSQGGYAAVFQ
jgi:hypothetical protein